MGSHMNILKKTPCLLMNFLCCCYFMTSTLVGSRVHFFTFNINVIASYTSMYVYSYSSVSFNCLQFIKGATFNLYQLNISADS